MRPTHQGLETLHQARGRGDLWLIHEREGVAIDGTTQVGNEGEAAAVLLVTSRAIDGRASSGIRRVLERHLRPAQQGGRGIAVIGIHTNTARDVKIEADAREVETRANNSR